MFASFWNTPTLAMIGDLVGVALLGVILAVLLWLPALAGA